MNKSKRHASKLFIIIFAMIANIQPAHAELVIQINYHSHQITQDGQPTMLIDPNLTITLGDQTIKRYKTGYFDYIEAELWCNDTRINHQFSGSEFTSDKYYQSDVHAIDQEKIWPNDIWSWLRQDSVDCQYNWQFRLYQANNLHPLLALGDAEFMKSMRHIKRQPNIPLQSNFIIHNLSNLNNADKPDQ